MGIMKAFGLCSFLIFCTLCFSASANIEDCDKDFCVDHTNMINYDSTSTIQPSKSSSYQNVPTKRRGMSVETDSSECIKNLEILQKEFDEHKKKGTAISSKPLCVPVFKRFLHKLLNEASKHGLPDDGNPVMHYIAEVKLTKQSLEEFQKLLNEENDWSTGAMDDGLSSILVQFKQSH